MSDRTYKVEQLSPADAAAFITKRHPSYLGKPIPKEHRKVIANGFELSGRFELTCREALSGEVAWQLEQENLITDTGRSGFFEIGFTGTRLGFAPSQETPNILRNSVPTDGTQCFVSTGIIPVVTPATFTKQWTTTFGTPAANRTLGIIFISSTTGTATDVNQGATLLWSYSLLTPPKTQTTTQTLEVIYKLSMNPIY